MNVVQLEEAQAHAAVWEDLLLTLTREWKLIFLVFFVTVVSAYTMLQLITDRYEASAGVLVKLGRENIEVPPTVEKGSVFSTGVRPEEINSEIQMLSSHSLIEATVDTIGYTAYKFEPAPPKTFLQSLKFYLKKGARWGKALVQSALIGVGLKKKLTEREKVIMGVENGLSVEREKDSDVISIRLRLPNPGLAVRTVETLLQLYLDRHIEVHRDANIREFFDNQVDNYKQQLSSIEKAKERVRSQWDLSSVEEQRKLMLKRLHEIYGQIDENEREKVLLQKQQLAMGLKPGAPLKGGNRSEMIAPDASVEIIKERMAELRMERVKLNRRYEPDSPPIKKLDAEVAGLIHMLMQGVDATIQLLRRQAIEIEQQLKRLNEGEDQLEVVERERTLAKQNYFAYAKRREETRVSEELDLRRVSNISVLSLPTSSLEPVYPRRLLIVGIAFPIGLLLGIGFALLLEYRNDKIRTQRDLLTIDGLPYLGTFRLPAQQPTKKRR